MLINDETHTICAGPGGITRRDNLHPDFLVIGKSIGGRHLRHRHPDVADRIARSVELEDIDVGGIGGTLAGNGLSMAAMRATLERVMTQDAFDHMIPLADAWADGIQAGIDAVGAGTTRLGARAEYNFFPSRRGTGRRRTTPTTSSCSSTSTSTAPTAASSSPRSTTWPSCRPPTRR